MRSFLRYIEKSGFVRKGYARKLEQGDTTIKAELAPDEYIDQSGAVRRTNKPIAKVKAKEGAVVSKIRPDLVEEVPPPKAARKKTKKQYIQDHYVETAKIKTTAKSR